MTSTNYTKELLLHVGRERLQGDQIWKKIKDLGHKFSGKDIPNV